MRHRRVGIARRDLSHVERPLPASLRLDAREFGNLGPLLGFVRNEPRKFGWTAGENFASQIGEPDRHLRLDKASIDFIVELGDNLGWGVPRRTDAEPGARLVTR